MNRSDKAQIIMIVYLAVIIVLGIVFYNFGKNFSGMWVGISTLLVQQFYFLPKVYSSYHKLNEVEENKVLKWIPWLNEVTIFPPFFSMCTLILGIILMLLVAIVSLPYLGIDFVMGIIADVIGQEAAMNYTFYMIVAAISVYCVLSVIRGLGFISIKSVVDREHQKMFPRVYKSFEGFQYFLYIFPLGRLLALSFLSSRLDKMVKFNDVNQIESVKFVEED